MHKMCDNKIRATVIPRKRVCIDDGRGSAVRSARRNYAGIDTAGTNRGDILEGSHSVDRSLVLLSTNAKGSSRYEADIAAARDIRPYFFLLAGPSGWRGAGTARAQGTAPGAATGMRLSCAGLADH